MRGPVQTEGGRVGRGRGAGGRAGGRARGAAAGRQGGRRRAAGGRGAGLRRRAPAGPPPGGAAGPRPAGGQGALAGVLLLSGERSQLAPAAGCGQPLWYHAASSARSSSRRFSIVLMQKMSAQHNTKTLNEVVGARLTFSAYERLTRNALCVITLPKNSYISASIADRRVRSA